MKIRYSVDFEELADLEEFARFAERFWRQEKPMRWPETKVVLFPGVPSQFCPKDFLEGESGRKVRGK